MAARSMVTYSTNIPRSASASVYKEAQFKGFNGLNNKYSNIEISDTESPDCQNVEFDAVGAITKRKGYVLETNSPSDGNAVQSIIPFYGTTHKLLAMSGNTIFDITDVGASSTVSTTFAWINSVPSVVTNSLHSSGARFCGAMDTVHNKLYLLDGNVDDGLMAYDGVSLSQVGNAPNGKYVLWYKNRLYIAGDPNAPNRLYMSDLGDPASWPNLNFTDIDDGYGGITGLSQLGDSIVLFKEKGVFILKGSGPSDYDVVTTFSGKYGCVSHWTIVQIPNGLLYLSRDGVYLFDGKKFELVSDKIQGSVDAWNQSALSNAVAFEYDHKYWLSVPEGVGQPYNNRTYVFSYLYGWWTRHTIAMNACAVYQEANTEEATPYFSDVRGNLFIADKGDSDNGGAIDAYLFTKAYDFGSPAHMKTFKQVFIFALAQSGNYNLDVSFIQDFGVRNKTIKMPIAYANSSQWGVMKWGESPWGGIGQVAHKSTSVPGQSRYLQFKIENADANAPFTFLGWIARYKMKARMV